METYKLMVNGQQKEVTEDPTPLGVARGIEDDGHQVRLRHRGLWRVHGAYRRVGRAVVRTAGVIGQRPANCDDRGDGRGSRGTRCAECVG